MTNQQLPDDDEIITYNAPEKDEPEEADTKIYLTDNSTLQTPEEYELDKNRDHHEESHTEATNVEDYETGNDGMEGSDMAGSADSD